MELIHAHVTGNIQVAVIYMEPFRINKIGNPQAASVQTNLPHTHMTGIVQVAVVLRLRVVSP